MTTNIRPVGTFVLVRVEEVEKVTQGGIVLPEDLTKKEQAVIECGEIIEFGPCCYHGWAGCESEDSEPHSQWGLEVGDMVEFRKYEGKASAVPGYENFRYIPDTHILGVISND